ncbi:glycoside hydrolase family 3 C-terminal domain-containing protein [Mucilaginibacter daejeonensis]|uniref:glycoside hydrolase family 3 N-terminal domain-containing protein n=1 Tax=Mucilaginibacter daejeonensis TaxID=398049 RepID=UPI001D17B1F4|nr:glycoside hydrolase family 3 N-terminal domain-containing protein [Mucilaginibacter daejeonensis]UEG51662.1 glycoside hydrolase family 3 C-terminal domain-containing protein [Mucilaginibacter daejeonensis]
MYKVKISLIALAIAGIQLNAEAQRKTVNQRVDSVMRLMTLDEKIGQLNQYSGREVTGPLVKQNANMLNDIRQGKVGSMLNVQGVQNTRHVQEEAMRSRLKIPLLFGMDVIHGYKTIFPVPLAESATWDMDLIRLSAHIAAKEAAAVGLHWTFAPMVDVARDPRWGRIMEGAGEDTYLGNDIARARVLGFQGDKLGGLDAVMACAKHFAAYGAVSSGRDYNDVEMSEHQLWETYLPPFKAAVDAGAATFMSSFNTLNGVPTAASNYLQRDILKGQWKYSGFVVSDWGSIDQMIKWGYVPDKKQAALKAIISGCDMDMMSYSYIEHLKELVNTKQVSIKLIDDAVKRILAKKFELGLFDDPYRFCNEEREKAELNNPEHVKATLKVAQRSIVLLKNEASILPIQNSFKKIAVIGPLADSKRDMQGAWAGANDADRVVTLLSGLKQKIGNGVQITYTKGSTIKTNDTTGFAEAVKVAKDADLVIMALGEAYDQSGESRSRADIGLPGSQDQLFSAVQATGKPVVAVLMAGRPLIFSNIAAKANAILYAWFLGDQAGNAIADVLTGAVNPSGKLPVTFPRSVGQIPLTYNDYKTGHPYNSNVFQYQTGYIDVPNAPRYAFGHGLSYTTFKYSDLKLDRSTMRKNGKITASLTLTNTGTRAGEEVVQMYIHDPVASVVQPTKKLKGYGKVALEPGASTTIVFIINAETLSFYNQQLKWDAEPGKFKVMIGSASDDIKLQADIELQ